jgi:SHS2 domain-containing protein
MDKGFEIIDHTADIGIRARGIGLRQAFTNAALGLFNLITDIGKVDEALMREVTVKATDREALLVAWLNELIYLFDAELIVFKRFSIKSLTDTELKARCYGEKIDKTKHELKRGIKSATYHMLKIENINRNSYEVQVLLDI